MGSSASLLRNLKYCALLAKPPNTMKIRTTTWCFMGGLFSKLLQFSKAYPGLRTCSTTLPWRWSRVCSRLCILCSPSASSWSHPWCECLLWPCPACKGSLPHKVKGKRWYQCHVSRMYVFCVFGCIFFKGQMCLTVYLGRNSDIQWIYFRFQRPSTETLLVTPYPPSSQAGQWTTVACEHKSHIPFFFVVFFKDVGSHPNYKTHCKVSWIYQQ